MDKASDFGSEDWGFESLRGRFFFFLLSFAFAKVQYKAVCRTYRLDTLILNNFGMIDFSHHPVGFHLHAQFV